MGRLRPSLELPTMLNITLTLTDEDTRTTTTMHLPPVEQQRSILDVRKDATKKPV